MEAAIGIRSDQAWLVRLRVWVNRVCKDPASIGTYSKGQQRAIALVLGGTGWAILHWPADVELLPDGHTWLDCINGIEPELLQACIAMQREIL